MEKLQFIYKRHSVRKFEDKPVPAEHLEEMIRAASYAPSGKNVQNWHFVVVRSPEKIAQISKIVEEKNAALAEYFTDEKKKAAFRGMVHYHTVFRKAPVLVLVYAGPYASLAQDLKASGKMTEEEAAQYDFATPGIQNIAAAFENFHLAAASLGYGTCWMTGPTYAAQEISDYLGFHKEGYHLAALSPLGVPQAGSYPYPPRKQVAEILTLID